MTMWLLIQCLYLFYCMYGAPIVELMNIIISVVLTTSVLCMSVPLPVSPASLCINRCGLLLSLKKMQF